MVLYVYAPQTGLEESTKDAFYDSLQTAISQLPDKEIVIPCGDWNGHVGREAAGYEGVHGGSGYGERNADGDRVLDACLSVCVCEACLSVVCVCDACLSVCVCVMRACPCVCV